MHYSNEIETSDSSGTKPINLEVNEPSALETDPFATGESNLSLQGKMVPKKSQ